MWVVKSCWIFAEKSSGTRSLRASAQHLPRTAPALQTQPERSLSAPAGRLALSGLVLASSSFRLHRFPWPSELLPLLHPIFSPQALLTLLSQFVSGFDPHPALSPPDPRSYPWPLTSSHRSLPSRLSLHFCSLPQPFLEMQLPQDASRVHL